MSLHYFVKRRSRSLAVYNNTPCLRKKTVKIVFVITLSNFH